MKRLLLPPAQVLRLILLGSLLCACSPHAQAQSSPFTIGRIVIDGHSRFSDEPIMSASGLKIGQAADAPALDGAANRLSQTGAFSEVAYHYETAK